MNLKLFFGNSLEENIYDITLNFKKIDGPPSEFQSVISIHDNEYLLAESKTTVEEETEKISLTFNLENSVVEDFTGTIFEGKLFGTTPTGEPFEYIFIRYLQVTENPEDQKKQPKKEKGPGEKPDKERGGPQQQGIMTPSGNYLPPIKQIKMGILPEEVSCNDGKELIFKSSDGSPKCLSSVAAEKLVERGWATR